MAQPSQSMSKRKEIYTYTAPWLMYGMNWSVRADQRFRLAVGSFEEEYSNSVRIIQLDDETHQFNEIGHFEHPYPATKIMWMPDPNGARRDMLATTGDYLRLWSVVDNKSVRLEGLLNNVSPGTHWHARTLSPFSMSKKASSEGLEGEGHLGGVGPVFHASGRQPDSPRLLSARPLMRRTKTLSFARR